MIIRRIMDYYQEDYKSAQANRAWDSILKKPNTNLGWHCGSSGKCLPSKHETLSSKKAVTWNIRQLGENTVAKHSSRQNPTMAFPTAGERCRYCSDTVALPHPWFQLPSIFCGPKIWSGKFQT
jgi:hypothetical protein